jgi:phage terminase large subunit-like protein
MWLQTQRNFLLFCRKQRYQHFLVAVVFGAFILAKSSFAIAAPVIPAKAIKTYMRVIIKSFWLLDLSEKPAL